MPDLQGCDICGADKPAWMVDHTTVPPIAPVEADICRPCQLVHAHELPDDVCMQCGDDLDHGYRIDLEYPLGPGDLPARKTGTLCGDCAGWIACDINYDGLDADEDAHAEFLDLVDDAAGDRTASEGSTA